MIENPKLAHLGARWWVTDENAAPTLSKATLGEFFCAVLSAGAQIGEIWPFNPRYPRSLVMVAAFMTDDQRKRLEETTRFRFRTPPMVRVAGTGRTAEGRPPIKDPMEDLIQHALENSGRPFKTENENEARLDFHLPCEDLYIEVKQFHTPRISEQMERVDNVIVGQGPKAVKFLADLISRPVKVETPPMPIDAKGDASNP